MADKSLYSRLKRLFSTNVIVRQVGGKKLVVRDTDHLQGFISRALMDKYARLHASYGPNPTGRWEMGMAYQGARLQLFRDYDVMDNDAIIASALDIYADETTVKSEYGEVLTIHSTDDKIQDILHNLFYDILNIEFNLWPWVRNMCKYGDFFLFLEISEKFGIHNVLPLSVYDTVRVEGEDPKNPYYVQFKTTGMQMPRTDFENFEIAHFRLLSDSNFIPYGKAMIEGARRTWKQLQLMEDAMIVHRLMRAPDRRIFKVDIGNIAPHEVDTFMQNMINKMKRVPLIDPNTGEYNLKFNMQNSLEDFYLPVRGSDSGTEITNLTGLAFNATDDIEYLRNKMMAALKIPKSFLGYEEAVNGKATLAAEDVRFARTIERIQRIVVSELTKIAIVHLYAQGYTDENLVNFTLELTNPSTIYEQEKLALWKEKVDLSDAIQRTRLLSSDWIYKNVFGMSEEEFDEQREQVTSDVKRTYKYSTIEQGQPDPEKYPTQHPEPQPGAEGQPPGGGSPTAPAGEPPKEEEKPVQEEQVGPGRPKKINTYGQDSHPRGRDPLGKEQRKKAMKYAPERRSPRKSPLSLEVIGKSELMRSLKTFLESKKPKPTMITEEASGSTDAKTYLDEENLLDTDETK